MANFEEPNLHSQESVTTEYQRFLKSSLVGNKVVQDLIARAFDSHNLLDQRVAIFDLSESIKSPVAYEFIACDSKASYCTRLFCLLSILNYSGGDQVLDNLIKRSLYTQTNRSKLPPDSLVLAKFITSTELDAGYPFLASFIRQFLIPSLRSIASSPSFILEANGVDPKIVNIECFARNNSLIYTTTLNDSFSNLHYSPDFTGETDFNIAFNLPSENIEECLDEKTRFGDIPESRVSFLVFNLRSDDCVVYGPVGFSSDLMLDLQSKYDFMCFTEGNNRHGFINFKHAKKEVLIKALQIALEQIQI